MKLKVIWIGSTKSDDIRRIIVEYQKRLKHYCKLELLEINKGHKSKTSQLLKKKESQDILDIVKVKDYVVLLDERGKQMTSEKFAQFLQGRLNQSSVDLVLVIGGAYGFDQILYDRANAEIALSKMTFTHDMARAILMEQLYRAFTILRGEKYHNP